MPKQSHLDNKNSSNEFMITVNQSKIINTFKSITKTLLEYLNAEDGTEEPFDNLIREIDKKSIFEDISNIKEFLTIINYISTYRHRKNNSTEKLEKILIKYKD